MMDSLNDNIFWRIMVQALSYWPECKPDTDRRFKDMAIGLYCEDCGVEAAPLAWRCGACDGVLTVRGLPPFDPAAINPQDWGLWRYAALLGVEKRYSLGEGGTALVPVQVEGVRFQAKLESQNPTGSFKDRGISVLLNYLAAQGVETVIEDSSGNAGAAVAAYAAAGGMAARIFVPASAPEGKKRLIRHFGAVTMEIEGPRLATTEACIVAAQKYVYASHAWNPIFLLGQMTGAWEVWEQCGRVAPDAVVCPIGQGGLFLGWYQGFLRLYEAGLIDKLPRFYATQSASCDPIVRAWESGALVAEPVAQGATVADGIVISQPVRSRAILAALRQSGGAAWRVEDAAIVRAHQQLARQGLIVEPTSAVPVAALMQQGALGGVVVVPFTGNGLKTLTL